MSHDGVRTHYHGTVYRHGEVRVRTGHQDPSGAVLGMPMAESRSGEALQSLDIGPGAVDGAVHILPDSIDLGLFVQDIRPPHVVGALPSLPDAEYPPGDYAFLTTTSVLYKNVADVWTVEDGSTITNGTLVAGLVRAGAIATEQLAADAVIANVANVGGTVLIDSTGITILNGAITLEDYSGQSVLTAAGFGGSWADFVILGVYNGNFSVGTYAVDVTAVTEVGGADTAAEYEQSLSAIVPMWVSDRVDANTAYGLRIDGSVRYLQFSLTAIPPSLTTREIIMYQDAPVTPGVPYDVHVVTDFNGPDGTWDSFGLNLDVYVEWRDNDHALISTSSAANDELTDISPHAGFILLDAGAAPAAARFARVVLSGSFIVENGGGAFTGANIQMHTVRLSPRDEATALEVGPWSVLGTSGFHVIKPLSGSTPAAGMLHIESGNGVFIENLSEGATGAPALVAGNGGLAWTSGSNAPDVFVKRRGTGDLTVRAAGSDAARVFIETDAAAGGGLGIQRIADTNARIFLNDSAGVPQLAFGDGSATRDILIERMTNPGLRFSVDGNSELELVTGGRLILANAGYFEMLERTSPGAPAANRGRLYMRDNGAGKTQLVVEFSSGAVQVIATQP